MNFTVIVLSGIDRNLSIALSVSSAWNPPFIRLLGPPLNPDQNRKLNVTDVSCIAAGPAPGLKKCRWTTYVLPCLQQKSKY